MTKSVSGKQNESHIIGVVVRKDHQEALALALQLKSWCAARGLKLLVGLDEDRTVSVEGSESVTLSRLSSECTVICSLGGDGTLISVARFSADRSPIFIGVHFGTLGFLTEIVPAQLFTALDAVLSPQTASHVSVFTRSLFSIAIMRDGKELLRTQALNDVVIQKGACSRLIEIDVHAGEMPVMRLRSDGLIIATPTGSTAYSMAAGGPIVEPSLAAMTLTPICPHSLTSRPLVLGTESELTVSVPDSSGAISNGVSNQSGIFAIIDGVETTELLAGDTVFVSEAPHRGRFFRFKDASYFAALRRKLHWNAPNDSGF